MGGYGGRGLRAVYFLVGMAMDGFRSDGKCVYLVLMVMGGPVEAFGMDRFEVL